MSHEKRLSLSFGDFACEIVGYDDPFTVLNKVMHLFVEVSGHSEWMQDGHPAHAEETRDRFAASLAKTAREFDLHIDDIDGKFVVSREAVASLAALGAANAVVEADQADEAEIAVDAPAVADIPASEPQIDESISGYPTRSNAGTVAEVADEDTASDTADNAPSELDTVENIAASVAGDRTPLVELVAEINGAAAEEESEPLADDAEDVKANEAAEAGTSAVELAVSTPEETIFDPDEVLELGAADAVDAAASFEAADELAKTASDHGSFNDIAAEDRAAEAIEDSAKDAPAIEPVMDDAAEVEGGEIAASANITELAENEDIAGSVADVTPSADVAAPIGDTVTENAVSEAEAHAQPRKRLRLSIAEMVDDAEKAAYENELSAASAAIASASKPSNITKAEEPANKTDAKAEAEAEAEAKDEPAVAPDSDNRSLARREERRRRRAQRITIDKARSRSHSEAIAAEKEAKAKDVAAAQGDNLGSETDKSKPSTDSIQDLTAALRASARPAPKAEAEAEAAEETPLTKAINDIKAISDKPEKQENENFLFDEDVAEASLSVEATTDTSEPAGAAPDVKTPAPVAAEDDKPRKKSRFGMNLFRRKTAEETIEDDEPEAFVRDPDALPPSKEDNAFARLQEAASADLPEIDGATRDHAEAGEEPRLFSLSDTANLQDANSPAAFAQQVGASSLQDLLEASAAYMAIVEGKAKFSRREVMSALSEIETDKDYSHEARLKSFRRLVTNGALIPSEDGMFAISHATRFGYENQLKAG